MIGKGLCLGAILVIVACAPAASGTPGTSAPRHSSNYLAEDQVAAFNPDGRTAYDLVSRLRPKWLVARGVEPIRGTSDSTEYALVVVDGHPIGRIGSLRDIQVDQLSDLRYYDVGEAGAKFGERGASGIIEVRLKNPRR